MISDGSDGNERVAINDNAIKRSKTSTGKRTDKIQRFGIEDSQSAENSAMTVPSTAGSSSGATGKKRRSISSVPVDEDIEIKSTVSNKTKPYPVFQTPAWLAGSLRRTLFFIRISLRQRTMTRKCQTRKLRPISLQITRI